MRRHAIIPSVALALTLVLTPPTVQAETVAMGGTFTMNTAEGIVGADLLEILGNENGWLLMLYDVELECVEEPGGPGETVHATTLYAESFEFTFWGPDAEFLNDVVADNFVEGGHGIDGGFFEVKTEYLYGMLRMRYSFKIMPRVATSGIWMGVGELAEEGMFELDDEGCPLIAPFEAESVTTSLYDNRPNLDGVIRASDASTIWLQMVTPVSEATWSTIKVMYE